MMSDNGGGLERLHRLIAAGQLPAITHELREQPDLVHAKVSDGKTPLLLAAEGRPSCFQQLVDVLLKNGANINEADARGRTALHYLTISGELNYMSYILDLGACTNSKDDHQCTPLHYAALLKEDYARLLIDHGAEINAPDAKGRTPIMWALRDGNLQVARLLWSRGAIQDVFGAAGLGELDLLDNLVRQHPSMARMRDPLGNTPLHWAAWTGQLGAAGLLLKLDSTVDEKNGQGMTALHVAVFRSADNRIVEILLNHNASVDAKDNKGRIPLHYAALKADPVKVGLLINRGSDVNALDSSGRRPTDLIFSKLLDQSRWGKNARMIIYDNISYLKNKLTSGALEVHQLLQSHGGRPSEERESGD